MTAARAAHVLQLHCLPACCTLVCSRPIKQTTGRTANCKQSGRTAKPIKSEIWAHCRPIAHTACCHLPRCQLGHVPLCKVLWGAEAEAR